MDRLAAAVAARLEDLPGAELVLPGIDDLRAGRRTAAALLVAIARPRLVAAGLEVPQADDIVEPEFALYALVELEAPAEAHARFNALVRRVVSFANALEVAVSRERRRPGS